MKKNNIYLTALLVLSFVFFVTGCKKEETIKSTLSNPSTELDAGFNIEELIEKTGIDVYALASSPELLRYFEAVAPISEKIAKGINNMSSAKDLTEDEKIERMHELVGLISQAAQNYNFDLVDTYFNEFESLFNSMPYPWDPLVSFSQSEMAQTLNREAEMLNDFLDSEYPTFFTLNSEQQSNIIDVIIDITRKPNLEKCARDYADDIRAAEIQYAITIAGCLFTGPGAWICAGVALGIYSTQHHRANKAYKSCLKG